MSAAGWHTHVRAQGNQRSTPWPHGSDDPTATKTLRTRYQAEAYRRFRALKGVVRETLIENDALGLAGGATSPGGPPGFSAHIDVRAAPPGRYDFPQDDRKVAGFKKWLDEQVERGILETGTAQRGIAADVSWQDTYIRRAYEKGVTHADAALVDAGVIAPHETVDNVFRAPMHADAAALLYTRAFNELDGVTSAMGQEISRELAEGLTRGHNPRKIATAINDRVDKVGLHRARLIARTETIRAHNHAALNRYGSVSSRLSGVTALVEFSTAGDTRVCPECVALEGMVVSREDAYNIIPVHPSCRCSWLPVPDMAG